MAKKNIIISITNPDPLYVSSDIRYARIDNTVSPVYITVLNVTANPLVIQNVDNGQYRIYAKPNFSDGRICSEQMIETLACSGVTALSATYNEGAGTFDIEFTADTSVPSVKINISFPNGGFSSSIHDNVEGVVQIPVPVGDVYGTYFITMQPVCDADTDWVGLATAPVTVEYPEPSP